MSKYEEVFESNKDLTEDEVVMAIYESSEGELSIKEAQSEYRTLAIKSGLIKTPQQKKQEWDEAVEELDLSDKEDVAKAKEIGDSLDIGSVTVLRYMKTMSDEGDFKLAVTTVVRGPSTWPAVVKAFNEEEALNGEREEVVAKINEIGEFDDIKKANSFYNKLRKEFGWEQPASMSSQLNDWFCENLDAEKKDIVEKGIEVGMSEGSANYYVGVYKIVKELLEKLEK